MGEMLRYFNSGKLWIEETGIPELYAWEEVTMLSNTLAQAALLPCLPVHLRMSPGTSRRHKARI